MKRSALLITAFILLVSCAPRYTINHSYPEKPLEFPKDAAAHYDAQTEWWYYTGHFFDEDKNEYGFELTFFKRITNDDKSPVFRIPAYWIKEVGMVGHFSVTDLKQGKFRFAQKINLFEPWKADSESYDVSIGDWSAGEAGGTHVLKAGMDGYEIDFNLTPLKNPVLNGPGGIVPKGGANGNYYYSITRMELEGTLTKAGKSTKVHGMAWMDHEYGSMKVARGLKGWDWFSLQLNDGTDIMIYMIRDKDKVIDESGGTIVFASGDYKWIKMADLEVKKTATWHSDNTGGDYPAAWDIYVKPLDLKLSVKPMMADQEMRLEPINYWEGAVSVTGSRAGSPVLGKGYVELVGYSKKSKIGEVNLD